ncbi:MAG: phosphotransferase [Candidatus Heimdallarchaeaceae archaeon]
MIEENIKQQINHSVFNFFNLEPKGELRWVKLEKGFSNTKYIISEPDAYNLAICKVFKEDGVVLAKERLRNEKKALEIFGGYLSPKLIWTDKKKILCYAFVEGQELIAANLTPNSKDKILQNIEAIHCESNRKNFNTKDVFRFYRTIFENYEKLDLQLSGTLQNRIDTIVSQLEKILLTGEQKLTFIHGDLVPPNILIAKEKVFFIDFEYFRVDLPVFDYIYFNYYSNLHKIPIRIQISKNQVTETYEELIDILNKLWWTNFQNF